MGKVKKREVSLNTKTNDDSDNSLTSHSSPVQEICANCKSSSKLKTKSVLEDYLKSPCSTKTAITEPCLTKTAMTEPCLGISSFHHFKLPKSLCVPSGSIFVGIQTSNGDESTSLCVEKEQDFSEEISSTPSYPNILRHSRNDLNKPKLLSSPIKTLTFSPSKFFNTSNCSSCEKYDLDTSRDISMFTCMSDVDDSGIAILDSSITDDIGVMPLTSTPSSNSCRKSNQHNISIQNSSSNSSFNTFESFDNDKSFSETPQIQKFLNTSVPQTPTPVKFPCDQNSSMKKEVISLNKADGSDGSDAACNLMSDKEICKADAKFVIAAANLKPTTTEQSFHFRRNLFDANNNCRKEKKLVKIEYRSSVNGKRVFLEKHRTAPYGKIMCKANIRVKRERSTSLNDQWVSVACGRTYDQRIMTAAAKKCMETE